MVNDDGRNLNFKPSPSASQCDNTDKRYANGAPIGP